MAATRKSGMQYKRKISTKVNFQGRNPGDGKDALGRVTAVKTNKRAD